MSAYFGNVVMPNAVGLVAANELFGVANAVVDNNNNINNMAMMMNSGLEHQQQNGLILGPNGQQHHSNHFGDEFANRFAAYDRMTTNLKANSNNNITTTNNNNNKQYY